MARKRLRWGVHQDGIAPERLVFIDETWVKSNMALLRGWGPRGQRPKAAAPFGHWKTMTLVAALRHDRIDAPWGIDGPINGEFFRRYIEQVLAPTLEPGGVVVMDNLGSHKHCNRGQQNITVEHIQVHAGGQAIVGVDMGWCGRGPDEAFTVLGPNE